MRIYLFFLMLMPFTLAANSGAENIVSGSFYSYSVHPDSWISLNGTTNVNSFECMSDRQMPRGHILADAHPKTNAIMFSDAILELEVTSFDCENRRMNRDLQNALGVNTHPHIRIHLLEAQPLPQNGAQQPVNIKVAISLNGVVKNTEVMVHLDQPDEYNYVIKGSKDLKMSDFNVEPPSPALGLIKVRDKINITFNLRVQAGLISQK